MSIKNMGLSAIVIALYGVGTWLETGKQVKPSETQFELLTQLESETKTLEQNLDKLKLQVSQIRLMASKALLNERAEVVEKKQMYSEEDLKKFLQRTSEKKLLLDKQIKDLEALRKNGENPRKAELSDDKSQD